MHNVPLFCVRPVRPGIQFSVVSAGGRQVNQAAVMTVDLRNTTPPGNRECLGNGDMQISVPVCVIINRDHLHACGKASITSTDQIRLRKRGNTRK